MKILYSLLFLAVVLFAKVDYSSMSTEELIAMMGYVPTKSEKSFKRELMQRVANMSKSEKKMYLKNLKKEKMLK